MAEDRNAQSSAPTPRRSRYLSDPAWFFVLGGGLIFVLYAAFGQRPVELEMLPDAPDLESLAVIEVSEERMGALREQFEWFEGRPPTADELRDLADAWIAEEVLFREALRSGLHRVDAKIREQLIDHMRLLHAGEVAEPDDAVLLEFYMDNIGRYYGDRKFTLEQVYFAAAPDDPEAVLAALRSGQRVAGEELWLGRTLLNYDESMLRSGFGGAFVNALLQAKPDGQWFGPVGSARGFHFVRLDARAEPAPLAFESIRAQVKDEWRLAELQGRVARFVAEKAPGYRILRPAQPTAAPD